MPPSSNSTKFGFRIRTRHGLVVEHLMIHGRNEADAERKLRQMYLHCEILERSVMQPAVMQPAVMQSAVMQPAEIPIPFARKSDEPSFEEVVSLISK